MKYLNINIEIVKIESKNYVTKEAAVSLLNPKYIQTRPTHSYHFTKTKTISQC